MMFKLSQTSFYLEVELCVHTQKYLVDKLYDS